MRLAPKPTDAILGSAATGTDLTIGPDPCLEPRASLVFVMKNGVLKVASDHSKQLLMLAEDAGDKCFVKVINFINRSDN